MEWGCKDKILILEMLTGNRHVNREFIISSPSSATVEVCTNCYENIED